MAFELDALILPMKTEDNAFRAGIARATMLVTGLFDVMTKTVSQSISLASDYAETVSKINVVFGDSADEMMDWAKTSATALGMSQNTALTAAGTFGNLFRAMKIGQQDTANMSKGLIQLAADLASFNNMDPTEVLDKLRAGLVGETEPLRSLGVNLNQAMLEQKALELGLWDGKEALDAAAKAQAAYAIIMEQTSLAQGDFDRTSQGLANQQRIMAAQWEDLKTKLGTLFLPVVTKATQLFNEFLSTLMDPNMSFDKFMEKADTFAAKIIKGLGDSINNWVSGGGPEQLSEALISFLDDLGTSEGARSKTAIAMQHLVDAMGEAISQIDWEGVWAAFDAAWTRLDIIVVDAINRAFIKGDEAINNAFIQGDEKIREGLNHIDTTFNEWVATDVVNALNQFDITMNTKMSNAVFGTWEKIKAGLSNIKNSFVGWASEVISTITTWAANMVTTISTWASGFNSTIDNKLREIAKTFFNRAVGWANQLVQGFQDGKAGILRVVTELKDAINGILRQIIQSFTLNFRGVNWGGTGGAAGTSSLGGSTSSTGVPAGQIGGRASGGPVIAGQMYNVAEFFRPERFVAPSNGRIDPIEEQVVTFDEDRLANVIARALSSELQKMGAWR